jgi:tetratricopeptide (TPR) repeat protein
MLVLLARIYVLVPQIVLSAILCYSLRADEVEEGKWVGKRVMWKEGMVASLNERQLDIERIPLVATVGEESGDLLWLSRAWVRKQDVMTLAQAIEHYSQQIEKEPTVARWHCRRAWALLESDAVDKAIVDFEKAIELEPKSVDAYVGLGWTKQSQGDLAGALKDSDHALAVDSKHPQSRRLRGVLFCMQRKFDEGIAEFGKAIELDPGYPRDHTDRAKAWHDKQEYDKALDDFQEAIRLDPRPAAAYALRGATWRELNEHERAANDYSEAIKRSPDDWLLFAQRGSAHEKLAKYEDAVADYKESIRLDSKNPVGHGSFARLLATCPDLKFRNGKVAIVHATKCCELTEYKDSILIFWLAAAYAEAGDSKNAVKWQEKANAISKDERAKRFGEFLVEHYRQGKRPERPR